MAQGFATLARVSRRHAWHDLIRVGIPDAWLRGPRLEEAPYPDALVARAVSDGRDLDLELRHGNGGGRVRLRLAGLTPGGSYAVAGAVEDTLMGDGEGEAIVSVDLDGRSRVTVVPRA